VPQREPEIIQRDIEQTRAQLAQTLDQIALRANPRRLADQGKQQLLHTQKGRAVIGGAAGLVTLLVTLRVVTGVRNHRKRKQQRSSRVQRAAERARR
jgi:hypothetical protein